jgi:hypothetical protein
MTATLIEQIKNLNGADAVEFLGHFNQMLVDGDTRDFDELLAGIPPAVYELPQFGVIKNLASGETQHDLTEQDSITLSKQILEILGQNTDLVPLLDQAWETWNPGGDLHLKIRDIILYPALAASMVIVVAATEVDVNVQVSDNAVKLHKHAVPIETVTELVKEFGKIISSSPCK